MNGRERQVGRRETQCGRGSLRQATRRPTRRNPADGVVPSSSCPPRCCARPLVVRRLRSPRELLRVLLLLLLLLHHHHLRHLLLFLLQLARYTLFLSSGRVAARRATGIPCASVSTYLCPAETRIAHRALVTSRAESSRGTLKPFRSHRDRPAAALSLLARARRKCAPFFENERGHRATCIRCGYREAGGEGGGQ